MPHTSFAPVALGRAGRLRAKAPLLLGALLMALVSCKVGPDYQRPEVPTSPGFKSAAASATQPGTQPAARLGRDWWRLFNDPELEKLEAAAGEFNQDLRAAVARVDQSRAVVRSTRSELFPTIIFDPSVTRSRSTGAGNRVSGTRTLVQVPIDMSYEVDVWGRVRRAVESSRSQLAATIFDAEVVRQTLQADVAINYFAIRSLDAQVQIVDRNIALYRRQVELAQKQFKVGLVSKTDSLQAQALLEGTLSQAVELRRQRADVEHALAILLGRPPAELSVEIRPLDLTPPTIPPGLPSELLRRRPDVAEAEANLVAANAQVGVAKANFYPTFRLTGAAGFESLDLQHALDWESRVWSIGPSVSIPIFEGGRLTAALEQAKARYEEVLANYRGAILNAYRDVEDALTDIHHRADAIEAQSHAVASSRELVALVESQYQKGLTNYLQVIDADRTLLGNELTLAQLVNQRLAATVLLIKALGGGWEAPSPTTAPAAESSGAR